MSSFPFSGAQPPELLWLSQSWADGGHGQLAIEGLCSDCWARQRSNLKVSIQLALRPGPAAPASVVPPAVLRSASARQTDIEGSKQGRRPGPTGPGCPWRTEDRSAFAASAGAAPLALTSTDNPSPEAATALRLRACLCHGARHFAGSVDCQSSATGATGAAGAVDSAACSDGIGICMGRCCQQCQQSHLLTSCPAWTAHGCSDGTRQLGSRPALASVALPAAAIAPCS